MNIRALEAVIRQSRMEPVVKYVHPKGEIFIARAYHNQCLVDQAPHWCYLWAAARGEDNVSIGQKLTFGFGKFTEAQMLDRVKAEAVGFLEANKAEVENVAAAYGLRH